MSVSDLVITKPGGLTTTESLASGLPIIVINPMPGQEEGNAKFIENNQTVYRGMFRRAAVFKFTCGKKGKRGALIPHF